MEVKNRKAFRKIYINFGKRALDVMISFTALVVLSPLFLVLSILVRANLGSPVLFKQKRPGLKEEIFEMVKFRTMSDARDREGNLLPDGERLTWFGRWLRETSLDELPELVNVFKGDMSLVGPRPQLVRDMVFMSPLERKRHLVKPGITGLAQVSGRNAISWERKLQLDLKYIKGISMERDFWILCKTLEKVARREGIHADSMDTAEDYGDCLLRTGKIGREEYDRKIAEAEMLLNGRQTNRTGDLVSIIMPSYNTGKYISRAIESVLGQTHKDWELIIVDDCSKDGTEKIVRGYEDPRIRYYRNQANRGAAFSRNRGLRKANGNWAAFLDSDDLWHPEKLERQIAFMRRNGYIFSYTEYEEIDERGRLLGTRVTGPSKITKKGMYRYCWPGCLTVMYSRDAVGDIQIADLKKNNDYAMWLKVCQKADCHLLKAVLGKYRRRKGSISSCHYKELVGWHYRLFREGEGKAAAAAWLYAFRNLFFGACKKLCYVRRGEKRDATE